MILEKSYLKKFYKNLSKIEMDECGMKKKLIVNNYQIKNNSLFQVRINSKINLYLQIHLKEKSKKKFMYLP
jgi:hypothetical protein